MLLALQLATMLPVKFNCNFRLKVLWFHLITTSYPFVVPVCGRVKHLYNNKPVKRFQMKSNGCRNVQHTGLQSTQTRRNTGKQGAQTRGTRSAHLPKHPYISGYIIIVGYANQFKVTKCLVANQFKVTKNWEKNGLVVRHAVEPLV